jgi:hypothetical protein
MMAPVIAIPSAGRHGCYCTRALATAETNKESGVKTLSQSSLSPASASWFRRSVLALVTAAGVLIVLGFARFPQITGSPLPYVALAVVAIVVVAFPAGLIVLATRATTGPAALTRSRSLLVGGILGVMWIAYTLVTHFIIPNGEQPTMSAILLWSVLVVTALAMLVVSLVVAWQTGRFTTGFATGLAIGFLTGALAMLTVVLMLDVGMGYLVQNMNAGEVAGFTSSGWANRQAWYYWNEEFFGSLGDFILLVLSGAVLGAIGAGIGRLLAAALRRSHTTS